MTVELSMNNKGGVLWNGGLVDAESFEAYLADAARTIASGKENMAFSFIGENYAGKEHLAIALKRHGLAFHPECSVPGIP